MYYTHFQVTLSLMINTRLRLVVAVNSKDK